MVMLGVLVIGYGGSPLFTLVLVYPLPTPFLPLFVDLLAPFGVVGWGHSLPVLPVVSPSLTTTTYLPVHTDFCCVFTCDSMVTIHHLSHLDNLVVMW